MILARTAFRGWLIVTLTATNVSMIAKDNYAGAFVVGGMISWVWWANTHGAAHSDRRAARAAYAVGAAVGTVTGMMIGRLL